MNTQELPAKASQFLHANFPDGFQFTDFRSGISFSGIPVFIVAVNDGRMDYNFVFSSDGTMLQQDIVPAFDEDYTERDGAGEFHQDDY